MGQRAAGQNSTQIKILLRRLALTAALLVCVWLEFSVYPGHTYLRGTTQVLVPMLERVDAPGLLSRDLVATHPILRYTIYDEVTLLLQRAWHGDWAGALAAQQFAARTAATTGVMLLAATAGISGWAALAIAAVAGLGGTLPGVLLSTADTEPLPYAIAFGFALLAAGLLAGHKVLLSGVAAGVALLYSPGIAGPMWIAMVAGAVAIRGMRPALRPLLTSFCVFALLLANLAQLQPGAPGAGEVLGAAPAGWTELLKARTPAVLVSTWTGHAGWLYVALWAASVCALLRVWGRLNGVSRWLLAALPAGGLLMVPVTAAMQRWGPFNAATRAEPTRALLWTVVFAVVLLCLAGVDALRTGRWREAVIWIAASATVVTLLQAGRLPVERQRTQSAALQEMAAWAEETTWGGSMFLFADAGRGLQPGEFRALSLRPVYVDWQSGELTRYYEEFGAEWRSRWEQVKAGEDRAGEGLARLLALPIDYYVLERRHELAAVTPVFRNSAFAVYDARDLRSARLPLRAISAAKR